VQENTQTKYNPKQGKLQPNNTTLVQSSLTTLGQETRRALSTTPPSPHGMSYAWREAQ